MNTLIILAAGMGSRYGGLKQLEGVGPSGETLMDYSIFDAKRAGFNKFVFIIRQDFEKAFKSYMDKYHDINIQYVYQDLHDLPRTINHDIKRTKPWGTLHAIWCARHYIQESFVVINADDFYGKTTFQQAIHLTSQGQTGLVCYPLQQTLCDQGPVNRGICKIKNNQLVSIREELGISIQNHFHKDELVSMNFICFHPSILTFIQTYIEEKLDYVNQEALNTCEFGIPDFLNEIAPRLHIHVIISNETWMGITYSSDKSQVVNYIQKYIENGIYPSNLFI